MLSIFLLYNIKFVLPFFSTRVLSFRGIPSAGGGSFIFFISREYSRRSLFTAGRRRKESTCHIFFIIIIVIIIIIIIIIIARSFFQNKSLFFVDPSPIKEFIFSFLSEDESKAGQPMEMEINA
jgi:hypothetical protein